MSKESKNRIIVEDTAKGIAICCVVVVHSIQFPKTVGMCIFAFFAYIMVFYFFVSGSNYKDKGLSYVQNIKKRLLQILIPLFICATFVMIVMGAYFLIRNEATLDDLIRSAEIFWMSKWGAQMIGWDVPQIYYQRILGPCWFILFLVTASLVFYALVSFAIKNLKTLIPTLILLIATSMVLIHFELYLPWGIQDAPAIAGLMILAAYLQKYNFISDRIKITPKRIILSLIGIAVFIIIQLFYTQAGLIAAGELGRVVGSLEVPLLYINAICGTYFLLTLSTFLNKTKVISRFFVWCGRNSFMILVFHLSFVHIANDILGIEQWNAFEKLFCETFQPMMIASFAISISFTCLFVLCLNKIISFVKSKNSIKHTNCIR